MERLLKVVDACRERILAAERELWKHPQTGYKEWVNHKYMADAFREMGYELKEAGNIPGFCTDLDTGREGPTLLILAELDSIICPSHPEADKQTGAVHSCGHHAQCAAMLGIAAALKAEGALEDLSGRIRLCLVPAEELLEIEYRNSLMKQGVIRYYGGKPEFMSRGMFDGVDLAFMVHTAGRFSCQRGSVGCFAKRIVYKGKAAHAGGAPWDGKNALYGATLGLNAVNAIRETFREADQIRVHPILTHGGDMVNAIPETATLESYVRGRSFQAMEDVNRRVNRALIGAALSMGLGVEIQDAPGYAPLENDPGMIDVVQEAVEKALPEVSFYRSEHYSSGSTDMGDLCCVMPVVHPYCGGAQGNGHGNDYYITDPEAACVNSAKMQLGMLYLLLENGASRAKRIVAEYEPLFSSPKEYLAYMDSLAKSGDRILYTEDGGAKVLL